MSLVASHHNDPTGPLASVPLLMCNAARWLVWKAVPASDPGKKPRKVPYYPDGTPRHGALDSQEDLARLGSLADAMAALHGGGYAGLGFALGPDGTGNHWQGADFDGAQFAELVASLPGYRERSPSGQGFHALGYGRAFPAMGSNGSGLEAYAAGRFFTMTGQGLGGELTCLADAVEGRLRPLHAAGAARVAQQAPASPEAPGAAIVPMDQTAADLRSALSVLSPDGYDLWYRMGLALKCLGDSGLGLWLEWSARSPKFSHREAVAKWATFQPAATGFRAVFAEAQRQGWENPNRHPLSNIDVPDAVKARSFSVGGQAWSVSFGTKAQLEASVTPLAFPAVTLNEWLSARPSPTPIVPGHFYADVGVFIAPGGTGKTTAVLWQAVHIALGRELWGMPVLKPGPVMILTAEDSRELLVARLRFICAELGLTDELTQLVAQRVRIGDVSGSGFRLTQVDRDVVRPAEASLTQLIEAAKAIGPVLLVIDPAVSFGVGESRVNDAEQGLIEAGRRIVREVGCGVIYVAHSGKANAREKTLDQYSGRGGSAFADGARMVHVLQTLAPADWFAETGDELQPGETGLILARPKGSYSVPQGPLYIKRHSYRFDAFDRKVRDKEQQRDDADHRVWRLLADELAAGRYHSARSLDGIDSGLKRAELRYAVARLLASGQVQERDRPDAQARGARKYLHPIAAAGEDGATAPKVQQETLLTNWQNEERDHNV